MERESGLSESRMKILQGRGRPDHHSPSVLWDESDREPRGFSLQRWILRKRDRSAVDEVYGKDGNPLRSWGLKGRGVEVTVTDGAAAYSVRMLGFCNARRLWWFPPKPICMKFGFGLGDSSRGRT